MADVVVPVTLDKSSPVPLYFQLAEQLTAAIDDGRLQPGDPFENEIAMCARLGLSRPTVRRAIQNLVDQGLLVRRRGLGTFIASRRVHRRATHSSLYEDLVAQGRRPSTVVLRCATEINADASGALDLDVETELLCVERIRYADGEPLAIMYNWLPPRFGTITQQELEADGLYAHLHRRGIRAVVAHQSVAARLPTVAERKHLGVPRAHPVITVTRTAFEPSGAPIEYAKHCYRSDAYTIDLVLHEG